MTEETLEQLYEEIECLENLLSFHADADSELIECWREALHSKRKQVNELLNPTQSDDHTQE